MKFRNGNQCCRQTDDTEAKPEASDRKPTGNTNSQHIPIELKSNTPKVTQTERVKRCIP